MCSAIFFRSQLIGLLVLLSAVDSKLTAQPRILGAVPASGNQFPWYVYITECTPYTSKICGGSLLNQNWVLSAAVCTAECQIMVLYFGLTDIRNKSHGVNADYWIEHEQYSPISHDNNIALVHLETPVNFSNSIQPISLWPSSFQENIFVGKIATVLGFGVSELYDDETQVLSYTKLRIVPSKQCEKHIRPLDNLDHFICAVSYGSNNHTTCDGDAGGAMVVSDKDGSYLQIGIIINNSIDICDVSVPAKYLRTDPYLSWIEQNAYESN